jgi:hypothetical protein
MKKLAVLILMCVFVFPALYAQTFTSTKEAEKVIKEFDRNNVTLFMSDVVLKRVSFEYERVIGDKGNMSINIPFSVALDNTNDPIIDDVVNWWVGLGMKLYPTGQGTIRYYIGPEVRIYGASGTSYVYYENYSQQNDNDYIHSAFLLNNGMIYEPTEHFVFGVNLGLGFLSRDSKDSGITPLATPSVRMGIRF